ncbi:MAG: serine/threonine protein kinase [Deltaproteobacteria bacterium]|nr:serine/threonine protein kinase [Deltaproteobacteria bacterium]
MICDPLDSIALAAIAPEGFVVAGKYLVERVIGEGGMAIVVAARHLQLDRKIALKILKPGFRSSPELVARFLREARAASHLSSEHVARMLDMGTLDQGLPFLVMEHLQGADLGTVLTDRGRIPLQDTVDFMLQAMDAIAEAHAQGIVHRDLKPENLFLTSRADGTPLIKVLDFGIAKTAAGHGRAESSLTKSRDTFGSPAYMSPEQIRSAHNVDARADVWALGVILYELVSGHLPFFGDTATETCATVLRDEPTPLGAACPGVPEAFAAVVHSCLEKDPDRRCQNVASLATMIAPFGGKSASDYAARIRIVLDGGLPSLPPAPAFTSSTSSAPLIEVRYSYLPQVAIPGPLMSRAARSRWAGLIAAATLALITFGGIALYGVNRWAHAGMSASGRSDASQIASQPALPPPRVVPPVLDTVSKTLVEPQQVKPLPAQTPQRLPRGVSLAGRASPRPASMPAAPARRNADMYESRR